MFHLYFTAFSRSRIRSHTLAISSNPVNIVNISQLCQLDFEALRFGSRPKARHSLGVSSARPMRPCPMPGIRRTICPSSPPSLSSDKTVRGAVHGLT